VTGDDHNTDALIAALRSPALPAERAGEAAAVTAMLGVLARNPASTRFRASRGIAIAVVTVASLGVGGLAAAGPGVFQAAANRARSLVTADSADDTETADGAANGVDPHSGSLPNLIDDPGLVAGVAAGSVQAGTTGGVACADGTHGQTVSDVAQGSASVPPAAQSDCGQSNNGAGPVTSDAPPPTCTDGNHGDAVSPVANASVPPSAEEDHNTAVNDASRDTCTPEGPQGNAVQGSNPNKPTEQQTGPTNSNPNGNETPGAGSNNGNQNGAGNGGGGGGGGGTGNGTGTPPATTPSQGNGNGNQIGAGNGNGGSGGQGGTGGQGAGQGGGGQGVNNGQDKSAPTDSVPADNGKGNANGKANGG
jgi:hypothetical protein